MLDQTLVAGTNQKYPGGLVAARSVAAALVAANPSGLADLKAYAPFSTGRISSIVMDADVKSSAEYISVSDGNPASLSHSPGWEQEDSNCVVEFEGGYFVNCAAIQGWPAADVQALIDARKAARANAGE